MCKNKKYPNRSKECSPCYVNNTDNSDSGGRAGKRGVLTIEAALVIPLFLIAMMTLLYVINLSYVYEKVSIAVCEEARRVSVESYDNEGIHIGRVQAEIEELLGEKLLNSGIIAGGRGGLDFSKTDLTDREIAVIAVGYKAEIPFALPVINELKYECQAVVHTWTGYTHGLNEREDASEYVYMTNSGTVYHRSRECSHIRLKIRCVSADEISALRNESGGKYVQCAVCRPKKDCNRLYITEDGDRYHSTLSCSGLIRTVIRVRLNSIEGVKPCSRCGY